MLNNITERRCVIGDRNVFITDTEHVNPDSGRLIEALRQIGYSLEQAISDLVDNAISANAKTVLIRFFWSDDEIVSLAVVDDGDGMSSGELHKAMRFGSEPRCEATSLGKFGLGLKLASFSHARTLTVATSQDDRFSARRWTLDGIRQDWECDVLSHKDAMELHNAPWSPIHQADCGAVIYWEDIDKLPTSSNGIRHTLRAIHRRLDLHLGLVFHRFLESRRLQIFIDQQEAGEPEHQIRVEVKSLNPFGYSESGAQDFPKDYSLDIEEIGTLEIEGHIWPPNSELREYKLGGKSAARQGFYFYRNDRLIQAGGWNGLMQSEADPHNSLARVRIDLPTNLDESFNLNVQKSAVVVPPGFGDAVRQAVNANGETFDGFRRTAESVYRNCDNNSERYKPKIPGKGIPIALRRKLLELNELDANESREVDFNWVEMPEDEFFRIDRLNGKILMNDRYRDDVTIVYSLSRNDVPLVKLLLYFLLERDLQQTKTSGKRMREIGLINRMLVAAARLQNG